MTATKDGCGGFFNDEPIAYATNTAIIMTMTKEESESVFSQGVIRQWILIQGWIVMDWQRSQYMMMTEMLGEVALQQRICRDGNMERQEEVPTVYLDYSSRLVSLLGTSKTMKH